MAREEVKAITEKLEKGIQNLFESDNFKNYLNYIQSGSIPEPIEWIVLDEKDGEMLLLSKYSIDCQQYNNNQPITWENCSLRKWLNNDFYNTAFSCEEQSKIIDSTVSAVKHPKYSIDPGNSTEDKVFLLSIQEVRAHFSKNSERKCKSTKYTENIRESIPDSAEEYFSSIGLPSKKDGFYEWWLRSPGISSTHAAIVGGGGDIILIGRRADRERITVRPSIRVNL